MVGYQNTNSNDKVKQAWRAYVAHINNPRTEGQARQRMIVSNLTQNYTALKEIITRGFEGVKYGGKAYQRFLSLNMKNAGQGPYIPKGTRSTPLPIPGMQISEGSIISIAVNAIIPLSIEPEQGVTYRMDALISDLYTSGTLSDWTAEGLTFGQFSQMLINNNTDVQDGDQLTFVTVSETENLEYVYRFHSIVLDVSSTTVLGQPYANRLNFRTYDGMSFMTQALADGRSLGFSIVSELNDEANVAGAVIQSRLGSDGKWLRSPAFMWVNQGNTEIMQYFSAEMYQLALESYMNVGKSTSTDWPVEPDAEIAGVWAKTLTSVDINGEGVTGSVVCAAIANSELQLKLIVKTVGGVQYLTNSNGSIVVKNNIQITAAMRSGASANIPLVDITTLDEYNVSLSRSLEEPPTAEDRTRKTKKS